ncbi:MAG: hypothetical protein HW414_910 [Dehalococcoidia bacterium]|nr:hypothetical protein [Dehalococcoidia bacterium]
MIANQNVLTEIRSDWKSVRRKQARVQRYMFIGGGHILPVALADFAYNLVLIYAYSVLHDILRQLLLEGRFLAPRNKSSLGQLMQASKNTLPWVDFALVDEGRGRRNKVAHKDLLIPRAETWKYIDAIEKELVKWGIIPDQGTDYSVPWGVRGAP